MQTRRDQLQAYRFLTRRALAALVTGEPNAVEPPMRRLTVTTISGIMIAVLITAGFLLLGFIKPDTGDKWKAAGTVIVERETGARYVLLGGVLHPALNYSSAVLAVSGPSGKAVKVTLVDRSDLKSAKRGASIGIDGIPDSLPPAGSLVRSPFAVCSREQTEQSGNPTVRVGVSIGADPAGTSVPPDSAVLARTPDGGATYVLWHGTRLMVGSSEVATALGLANAPTVVVGTAFLDSLTPGTTLQTPHVHGLGTDFTAGSGSGLVVGQLLEIGRDGPYWVVLDDGIASVNKVEAELLQTLQLPDHTHVRPVRTTEAAVLDMPQSKAGWAQVKSQFDGLPITMPSVDADPAQSGGLCAIFRGSSEGPSLAVPAGRIDGTTQTGTASESAASKRGIADTVQLKPGSAAVARSSDGSHTVFVIAGPGRKYAAASAAAFGGFGYGAVKPVSLPPQFLALIPNGPALDPEAARRPVSG